VKQNFQTFSNQLTKYHEGMPMRTALLTLIIICTISNTHAEIKEEIIEYQQGQTTLKGLLVYDTSIQEKRPGVLVVHEWWGITDHPKNSARQLARLGYTAFALDMYGDGQNSDSIEEAKKNSGLIKSNTAIAAARFQAAVDVLSNHPTCDENRIAAIGYCFGGTVVLEMARLLQPQLLAVVSFHGGLNSTADVPADQKIKAKVLVCHGADDPYVPAEQIADFQDEMRQRQADWQMIYYSGARHAFTNPTVDKHGLEGA